MSVVALMRQRWELAQEIIFHDGIVSIKKNKELREQEKLKKL